MQKRKEKREHDAPVFGSASQKNIRSRPADFVKKLTFNLGVDKVYIIWYIIDKIKKGENKNETG